MCFIKNKTKKKVIFNQISMVMYAWLLVYQLII